MFVTPAFAQTAGGAGGAAGIFSSIVPILLIFAIFYFLMIRPQQRKAKEHAQMVQNLRRGDTVLTAGGIIAKVTKVGETDEIEVEIAKDVKVKLDRRTITVVMSKTEPANSN